MKTHLLVHPDLTVACGEKDKPIMHHSFKLEEVTCEKCLEAFESAVYMDERRKEG